MHWILLTTLTLALLHYDDDYYYFIILLCVVILEGHFNLKTFQLTFTCMCMVVCVCVVWPNNNVVENLNKILKSYIINFPIHGIRPRKVKWKVSASESENCYVLSRFVNIFVVVVALLMVVAVVLFILTLFCYCLLLHRFSSLMWKIFSSHLILCSKWTYRESEFMTIALTDTEREIGRSSHEEWERNYK